MGKTRVGVLFRESMGGNKSTNKSADLATLTQKYYDFCKQMRGLVTTLKKHHEAMQIIQQSRSDVSIYIYMYIYYCLFLMGSHISCGIKKKAISRCYFSSSGTTGCVSTFFFARLLFTVDFSNTFFVYSNFPFFPDRSQPSSLDFARVRLCMNASQ
jgi:hypothetical protein